MFKSTLYLCVIALMAFTISSASAKESESLMLKTYEVGDLVLQVNDRPLSEALKQQQQIGDNSFGGGMAGMGGGAMGGGGYGGDEFGRPQLATRQRDVSIDRLISIIQATVLRDTWSNMGGTGEIQSFGTGLVISQTAAGHQSIEDLLKSLRAGSGERRTLSIDARWLQLDSEGLEGLTDVKNGVRTVNREVLRHVTKHPKSLRAITNCFSGQLVYLTSGTRRNLVESWIPVVGSNEVPRTREHFATLNKSNSKASVQLVQSIQRSVGYQPVIKSVNFGSLLEIRPTQLVGSKTVVADLKSTITVAATPKQKEAAVNRGQGVPEVDQVAVETQELSTTLRMPLGEPVLVGGMTFRWPSEEKPDGKAAAKENPQMYLVLEIQ